MFEKLIDAMIKAEELETREVLTKEESDQLIKHREFQAFLSNMIGESKSEKFHAAESQQIQNRGVMQ